MPDRLRLALLVFASVCALLIVADRARAGSGITGPSWYPYTHGLADAFHKSSPAGVDTGVITTRRLAPCEVGTWSNTGSAPCIDATPGHFVDTSGARNQIDCPVGFFANQVRASGCLPSPAGFFVVLPASDHAELCPAGSYQPDMGQAACLLAPRGYFVAASGAERAMPCAAGSYQPQQGQVDCLVAPVNTYVNSDPPISTADCPTGSTSARGSSALADCIQPPAVVENAVPPTCSVAVSRIVSAACVAKALSVSLAGARSVVLRPIKAKQAACRIVKGRVKTVAAGVCKVVLVVKSKQGRAVSHRASVTVTR